MHKTIALFNHKGGVSKTTTTFNLGWMLVEKGKRVVMIDTDPQCNLTGLFLGYESTQDLDTFYQEHPNANIKDALSPAFEAKPTLIESIECIESVGKSGLFLVPGHVNLSEYEVTLGIAQELSGSLQALKNLPGAFYYFICKVAEANNADYVLIDMSPSLGALNQNFLMSSNFFIIPTVPDYFNVMAINSLASILPKWFQWAKRAGELETLKSATYPFPKQSLKFLGTVIQRYRLRKGKATIGFQDWINQINDKVVNSLFPALQKNDGTFMIEEYKNAGVNGKDNFCLAEISDFNTLVTASQNHQTPVFALTEHMFGHTGIVLEQDMATRNNFFELFSSVTDKIISLTSNE